MYMMIYGRTLENRCLNPEDFGLHIIFPTQKIERKNFQGTEWLQYSTNCALQRESSYLFTYLHSRLRSESGKRFWRGYGSRSYNTYLASLLA